MTLIKPVAWSDIALGIWLLAAPSVIGYQSTRPVVLMEDLAPGLFLCITSGVILAIRTEVLRVEWLQALCGLWLMVGSVVLMFNRLPQAALNSVLVGVGVVALSATVWLSGAPTELPDR